MPDMTVFSRPVRTVSVALPGTFDEAVAAFERAAPHLDPEAFAHEVRTAGDWSEISEWTAQHAPHGFIVYCKNDVRPLMGRAGDPARAIAYLLGNHVTAEKMFRLDPRVMIYAPLRVALTHLDGEPVLFTADVPSDLFGGYGVEAIAEVARGLDRSLAALLELLGAEVPAELVWSAVSA